MKLVIALYRFLFARPIFHRFNDMLFRLSLRGLGILNYENMKITGEEFLITKFLPKIFGNKEPIIFDVGANIGEYTNILMNSFPKAKIYSFEPHPATFSVLLSKNFKDNIKLYNIALGEKEETLSLYNQADDNEDSTFASLHREAISEILKKEVTEIKVPVNTLDNIAKTEKLNKIDFLKIDTEGNELAVLKGASFLLNNCKIGCIHFEFNEMNVISRTFMRDFRVLLKNYRLYRLLPHGLLPLNDIPLSSELFAFQNILAIPTDKNIL